MLKYTFKSGEFVFKVSNNKYIAKQYLSIFQDRIEKHTFRTLKLLIFLFSLPLIGKGRIIKMRDNNINVQK